MAELLQIDALIHQAAQATTRDVRAVLALVADIRRELGVRLADAKGFELQRLSELREVIDGAVARFQAGMTDQLAQGQARAISQGLTLVDVPLAGAEIAFVATDISTALLHSVSEQTGHLITDISTNLRRDITREVQLGALGVKSPFEALTTIRDMLRTAGAAAPQGYAARAEAITRTEIGRAQSEATQARLEQAARTVPGLYKEWRHAGGGRQSRPTHVAASGQRRRVNERFSIGGVALMYPRDSGAGPGETVNCRCVSVPYIN